MRSKFSHNDGHGGNMMMDKNDTTADSLILIDWDMTQYGYRKCVEVFLGISDDVDFVITCVELDNFNVNLVVRNAFKEPSI